MVSERNPRDHRPGPESVPPRPTSRPSDASSFRPEPANWGALSVLLAASALIRVAMFNGLLGSDDVLYLRRALEVSQGVWSSGDYNGALRYGFNIPAGLSIYLFGPSVFSANLWCWLSPLPEAAAFFLFAPTTGARRLAPSWSLALA